VFHGVKIPWTGKKGYPLLIRVGFRGPLTPPRVLRGPWVEKKGGAHTFWEGVCSHKKGNKRKPPCLTHSGEKKGPRGLKLTQKILGGD